MNNMLFQIGRYFIEEKHEVTFFLFDEPDHFLPEADTFENISKYKIIKLGWNFETFLQVPAKYIKTLLKDFEFLIGTDLAPAYLFKAGLKLDIYFPHGSDLYEYPFFKYRNTPPQLWEIPANIISRAQYYGIREANVISLDPSDEVYEKPCAKIRTKNKRRISTPPFLYFKQYTEDYPKLSSLNESLHNLRKQYEFIVFQQISQDWSMRGPYKIDKGNNHLINGFAHYLKRDTLYAKDSVLILMEYGGDVDKSKQLIKKLGIEKNVIWFKKMNRKDLMAVIHYSDICVGELGYRKWYSYSSIIEFMAMKKPLIHHRGDDFYKAKGMDLYPMVDAKSAEEVAKTFFDYRANPNKYVMMGKEANAWILNDAEKKLATFKEMLLSKRLSNEISFKRLKLIAYYFNPNILYNYFFLGIYRVKAMLKE
ncbi:MAG: hypothetical protein JNM96_06285 [Bacteroidia bacterium]|nr:hypothetical protein [Bacteroidia bacterium]